MALQTDEIVYSTSETAKLLKLSHGTIAVYVQRGLLVPRKIGNISVFTESEIKRFKALKRPRGNPNFVKSAADVPAPATKRRKTKAKAAKA